MTPTWRRLTGVAALAALTILAACGLPRAGPNKSEIFAGSVLREGDAFVLVVDDRVNAIASVTPALGFSAAFQGAGVLGADTIQPGDTLVLTVFENVDDGLIVPAGANATVLSEIQVDGEGFIFVPYAGRIRAAGNSPEAVRRAITERLQEQTPEPQIQVARIAGDGAAVSVAGDVGAPGVYPIERPTRTLAAMIARAGGPTGRPASTQVTLVRGGQRGSIWFEDLYAQPLADVALRNGDRILVETGRSTFTVLGATGTQTRLPFDTRSISAIEAIAQVGGLSPTTADPTGVFVFRNEPEAIAQRLLGRTDLTGTQRVIYVLDLTRPNGMFFARDFAIRDGDTVYVTEAPFVQFSRIISALTGTLDSIDTAAGTVAP
ncbi:polysaccharide biosynthesis/export family protein [Rubellimicrobium sp. CFH 75288]|uniref:polysaccharide biosynthesis/export family protein n=1 Tax=Rubellimicrobium sp. CFH 75288 TaxID=2697034 RepID=UPI003529DF62